MQNAVQMMEDGGESKGTVHQRGSNLQNYMLSTSQIMGIIAHHPRYHMGSLQQNVWCSFFLINV